MIDHSTVTREQPFLGYKETEVLSSTAFLNEIDFRVDGEWVAPINMAPFTVLKDGKTSVDQHQVKEIWFVVEGKGDMELGARNLTISAGDSIWIPPNTNHQVFNRYSDDMLIISVWWQ